jgi:3-phenylpropionate/trans-cinnamate dioxygenase ferredoxin component
VTEFLPVLATADLPADGVRRVDLDGTAVAVVRVNDEYYALGDTCTHDEVSLADGELEGTTLECWLHGSRFDVRTGRPLSLPARQAVPVYDVKVIDDRVYVSATPSARTTIDQEFSR